MACPGSFVDLPNESSAALAVTLLRGYAHQSMKWIVLALALVGLAFACTSDDDTDPYGHSDGSTPCGQCLFNQCCLDGICVDGNSPQSCGTHGADCRTCSTGPCINGACVVETCNSLTCRDGCCSAGGCQVPPSNLACGINGSPCDSCGVDQMCENGRCINALARSYRVILVGANLPAGIDCGWLDECDPFAVVTFAARADEQITTGPVEDNLSPTWNKELISATPGELTSGAIKIELLDDDALVDQSLGTCQPLVTREELIAGSATRACNSSGISFHVSLSFRPVEG